MKQKFIEELEFCLKLWAQQGHCEFRGYTKCEQYATPYLLLKLINSEVLHGKDIKRLTLEDWKKKVSDLKQ